MGIRNLTDSESLTGFLIHLLIRNWTDSDLTTATLILTRILKRTAISIHWPRQKNSHFYSLRHLETHSLTRLGLMMETDFLPLPIPPEQ